MKLLGWKGVVRNSICSPASFEVGFLPAAEVLDDIAVDTFMAYNPISITMKCAGNAYRSYQL